MVCEWIRSPVLMRAIGEQTGSMTLAIKEKNLAYGMTGVFSLYCFWRVGC